MTDQQHPITPPPELLVQQWLGEYFGCDVKGEVSIPELHLATRAAQWGADQELDVCCEWLRAEGLFETRIGHLRAARRPKPLSLKEQALALINHDPANQPFLSDKGIDIIRRALEQLDD